jgi:K+-transporting ATPase ATPase C chain
MWKEIAPAFKAMVTFTVLLGLAYPLAATGLAQLLFPDRANGSLILSNGQVVGSSLIGQSFAKPAYFHPRPSAAGNGYDATMSGGSNYGPTNQKLIDRIKADIEKFRQENPEYHGPIPADMVTASGSGLDPHISPASALAQAARVAKARAVSADQVNQLIAQFTEGPSLGFLGEPRVNVLQLNLALDRHFPSPLSAR